MCWTCANTCTCRCITTKTLNFMLNLRSLHQLRNVWEVALHHNWHERQILSMCCSTEKTLTYRHLSCITTGTSTIAMLNLGSLHWLRTVWMVLLGVVTPLARLRSCKCAGPAPPRFSVLPEMKPCRDRSTESLLGGLVISSCLMIACFQRPAQDLCTRCLVGVRGVALCAA